MWFAVSIMHWISLDDIAHPCLKHIDFNHNHASDIAVRAAWVHARMEPDSSKQTVMIILDNVIVDLFNCTLHFDQCIHAGTRSATTPKTRLLVSPEALLMASQPAARRELRSQ